MATLQDLIAQLGPDGVRRLQEQFDQAGLSEPERDAHVQSMLSRLETQLPSQGGQAPPGGYELKLPNQPSTQGPGGYPGGLPGPQGGLVERPQTPTLMPGVNRPPGMAGELPPQSRGPVLPEGPESKSWWQRLASPEGVAQIAGGLQSGLAGFGRRGRGGGGGTSPFLADMLARRRQSEDDERTFARQMELLKQRSQYDREGIDYKAQLARQQQEQSRAALAPIRAQILADERIPQLDRDRAALSIDLQMMGRSEQEAKLIVSQIEPRKLHFLVHEGTSQGQDPYTGQPVGPALTVSGPKDEKITTLPGDRVSVQPARAPYSGPTQDFPMAGPSSMVEFPQKPEQPKSSAALDSVAQFMYKGVYGPTVTYNQLEPAEQQKVYQRVQADEGTQRRAGATTVNLPKQEQPLIADIGRPGMHLVNRKTGQDMSLAEKAKYNRSSPELQNFTELDATQHKALQEAKGGFNMMSRFIPAIQQLEKDPLMARPGAWVAQVGNYLGYTTKATLFRALDGLALQLGRAMQGSAQNLSNVDVESVRGMLPKDTDSYQNAMIKMKMMYDALEMTRRTVLGEDMSGQLKEFVEKQGVTFGGKGKRAVPSYTVNP